MKAFVKIIFNLNPEFLLLSFEINSCVAKFQSPRLNLVAQVECKTAVLSVLWDFYEVTSQQPQMLRTEAVLFKVFHTVCPILKGGVCGENDLKLYIYPPPYLYS